MQHKFAARAGGCYTDAQPSEIGKQCEDIVFQSTVLSLQRGRRVCTNMYEHVNLK